MPAEPPADDVARLHSAWNEQYAGWDDAYRVPPERIRRWARKTPASWLWQWAGLQPRERVLEAGCGGGGHGLALAFRGCDVTLVDFAPQVLASAERNLADLSARFGVAPSVTLRCVDLLSPDADGLRGFSLVYNIGVIEHLASNAERVKFLQAMAAAARPGGHVAVAIPNNCHPWTDRWRRQGFPWLQDGHRLREAAVSCDELRSALQSCGLVDIRIDGYALHDTLLKWPKRRWLEYVVRGAARLYEPRFTHGVRMRWGTWWLAMGRTPTR